LYSLYYFFGLLVALEFISFSPKFSASVTAASLPEGSIIPCNKSITLNLYPNLKYAVVPGVVEALLLTVKYVLRISIFSSLAS